MGACHSTDRCPEGTIQSSPAEAVTRSTRFPLKFNVGEYRLFAFYLPVTEVQGHFLERPVTLDDVMGMASVMPNQALLGRSVLVPDGGRDIHATDGVLVYRLGVYRRFYIPIAGRTFEDYLAGFSSKSRSTLQRKVRKFENAEGAAIDWSTYRAAGDVEAFLGAALPLSRRTYQHRLLKSGLPESSEFAAHLRGLASSALFRGWILRFKGEPIAYICAMGTGRTLLYDYVGFDSAHGALSPGTVLQFLVLEQLHAEGDIDHFDFTEGEGPHKEFFGTAHRRCADVLVSSNSRPMQFLFQAHRCWGITMRSVAGMAQRFGVKTWLKKLLRGQ